MSFENHFVFVCVYVMGGTCWVGSGGVMYKGKNNNKERRKQRIIIIYNEYMTFDQKKCLIDGPLELTGVARQVISYSRLALTDLTVKIQFNARQKTLVAAWKDADTQAKWDNSSWAKKLSSKKTRLNLSDFSRFKVMIAKKQKAEIITKKMIEIGA